MRLTMDDKWRIYEMYYISPRRTAKAIAREYGISPGCVLRIAEQIKALRLNDLFYQEANNRRGMSRFRMMVCREYESGLPASAIARRHRLPRSVVAAILKRRV